MEQLQKELEQFSYIVSRNTDIRFDGQLESIFGLVSAYTNTDNEDNRKHAVVFNRQLSHAIAKSLTRKLRFSYSLQEIGLEIGKKDHATVLHSAKTIKRYLETGYMTDVIVGCASVFGLTGEDLTDGSKIGKQVVISIYKDGVLAKSCNNKRDVAKWLKCSIVSVRNYFAGEVKTIKGYTLKLEICK